MSRQKSYWCIEITVNSSLVYRRFLPGNLNDQEIVALLQRLACRNLTHDEIVACSVRESRRSTLLEPRIDSPPRSQHRMIWLPDSPDYTASYWQADEVQGETEIG